jgi:hypothetical protein
MHDVLVVFCQDSVIIFAGSKKINYLKQVEKISMKYLIWIGLDFCRLKANIIIKKMHHEISISSYERRTTRKISLKSSNKSNKVIKEKH